MKFDKTSAYDKFKTSWPSVSIIREKKTLQVCFINSRSNISYEYLNNAMNNVV